MKRMIITACLLLAIAACSRPETDWNQISRGVGHIYQHEGK